MSLTVTSYQVPAVPVIGFIVRGNTTPIGPFVKRRAVGISVGGGFKSPTSPQASLRLVLFTVH
ncbi:hypothetical protein [Scytonema sp. HK-05]|uniref:hypothetical protein n=1 Tax=Scytonema sp. HK-05 TaxID=1137095 RepID=UPI001160F116|nr:hypothetical protein [Scytonema sp. HK-05]